MVFMPGDYVFSKVRGFPPWPSVITGVDTTGSKIRYSVFFFGTRQTAVLQEKYLFSYIENRKIYGKNLKRSGFLEGLIEVELRLGNDTPEYDSNGTIIPRPRTPSEHEIMEISTDSSDAGGNKSTDTYNGDAFETCPIISSKKTTPKKSPQKVKNSKQKGQNLDPSPLTKMVVTKTNDKTTYGNKKKKKEEKMPKTSSIYDNPVAGPSGLSNCREEWIELKEKYEQIKRKAAESYARGDEIYGYYSPRVYAQLNVSVIMIRGEAERYQEFYKNKAQTNGGTLPVSTVSPSPTKKGGKPKKGSKSFLSLSSKSEGADSLQTLPESSTSANESIDDGEEVSPPVSQTKKGRSKAKRTMSKSLLQLSSPVEDCITTKESNKRVRKKLSESSGSLNLSSSSEELSFTKSTTIRNEKLNSIKNVKDCNTSVDLNESSFLLNTVADSTNISEESSHLKFQDVVETVKTSRKNLRRSSTPSVDCEDKRKYLNMSDATKHSDLLIISEGVSGDEERQIVSHRSTKSNTEAQDDPNAEDTLTPESNSDDPKSKNILRQPYKKTGKRKRKHSHNNIVKLSDRTSEPDASELADSVENTANGKVEYLSTLHLTSTVEPSNNRNMQEVMASNTMCEKITGTTNSDHMNLKLQENTSKSSPVHSVAVGIETILSDSFDSNITKKSPYRDNSKMVESKSIKISLTTPSNTSSSKSSSSCVTVYDNCSKSSERTNENILKVNEDNPAFVTEIIMGNEVNFKGKNVRQACVEKTRIKKLITKSSHQERRVNEISENDKLSGNTFRYSVSPEKHFSPSVVVTPVSFAGHAKDNTCAPSVEKLNSSQDSVKLLKDAGLRVTEGTKNNARNVSHITSGMEDQINSVLCTQTPASPKLPIKTKKLWAKRAEDEVNSSADDALNTSTSDNGSVAEFPVSAVSVIDTPQGVSGNHLSDKREPSREVLTATPNKNSRKTSLTSPLENDTVLSPPRKRKKVTFSTKKPMSPPDVPQALMEVVIGTADTNGGLDVIMTAPYSSVRPRSASVDQDMISELTGEDHTNGVVCNTQYEHPVVTPVTNNDDVASVAAPLSEVPKDNLIDDSSNGPIRPKFKRNDKVFAKVHGHPYWPAKISEIDVSKPPKIKYQVHFYGLNETDVVREENLVHYAEGKEKYSRPKRKRKGFVEGIMAIERSMKSSPPVSPSPYSTPEESQPKRQPTPEKQKVNDWTANTDSENSMSSQISCASVESQERQILVPNVNITKLFDNPVNCVANNNVASAPLKDVREKQVRSAVKTVPAKAKAKRHVRFDLSHNYDDDTRSSFPTNIVYPVIESDRVLNCVSVPSNDPLDNIVITSVSGSAVSDNLWSDEDECATHSVNGHAYPGDSNIYTDSDSDSSNHLPVPRDQTDLHAVNHGRRTGQKITTINKSHTMAGQTTPLKGNVPRNKGILKNAHTPPVNKTAASPVNKTAASPVNKTAASPVNKTAASPVSLQQAGVKSEPVTSPVSPQASLKREPPVSPVSPQVSGRNNPADPAPKMGLINPVIRTSNGSSRDQKISDLKKKWFAEMCEIISREFGHSQPLESSSSRHTNDSLLHSAHRIAIICAERLGARMMTGVTFVDDDGQLYPDVTDTDHLGETSGNRKRDQKRIKKPNFRTLLIENLLVDRDRTVRASLNVEKPELDPCITALKEMDLFDVTYLMLKKYPEVVGTLEKVGIYSGVEDIKKEDEFLEKAQLIRTLAVNLYRKFAMLYSSTSMEFTYIHTFEVKRFKEITAHMELEDYWLLQHEPTCNDLPRSALSKLVTTSILAPYASASESTQDVKSLPVLEIKLESDSSDDEVQITAIRKKSKSSSK